MASEQEPRITHVSVLLNEAVDGLAPERGGRYVDGTAGGGGHSSLLLERSPEVEVLAMDRDPAAVERVRARLAPFGRRAHVVHGCFDQWRQAAEALGWGEVDGVLLDLGFSSYQMDEAERGFSFMREGRLDMRMDPTTGVSASELIDSLSEQELVRIFREYGEEPDARRIARAIVAARPIETTAQLADVVSQAVPAARRRARIHPATLVFQALRIAVNDEMGQLERFLADLPGGLRSGGRVAIISFHSLEDRKVKRRFRELATECVCPPGLPVCACGRVPEMREITRKAVKPGESEVEQNPRARSARLRVAARV